MTTTPQAALLSDDEWREAVMSVLAYSPETGEFRWRCKYARNTAVGELAGTITRKGYRIITVLKQRHMAHRLAWLFVHGSWPSGVIDHLNGIRTDNRISNLRDVTPAINRQNQRNVIGGRTCKLGVYRRNGRFVAQIQTCRVNRYIGTFDTEDEAHAAYLEAKRIEHQGCTL